MIARPTSTSDITFSAGLQERLPGNVNWRGGLPPICLETVAEDDRLEASLVYRGLDSATSKSTGCSALHLHKTHEQLSSPLQSYPDGLTSDQPFYTIAVSALVSLLMASHILTTTLTLASLPLIRAENATYSHNATADTTKVACVYSISGQYELLPRSLYYLLLAFGVIAQKQTWLIAGRASFCVDVFWSCFHSCYGTYEEVLAPLTA